MTKEEILQTTKAFLLDLDGTVSLEGVPLFGVEKTLCRLRDAGKQLVFLTNNSSKTRARYEEELARTGLFLPGDLVYTSANAAAEYLNENFRGKRVYLLATNEVKAEFEAAGVRVAEENPDVCVLAYDKELTFEKIKKFDGFLRRGVFYLATHPDAVCPAKGGSIPDAGAFAALFRTSSGRAPDLILGKPYPYMADGIAKRLKLKKEALCMVGDRTYTDIRFANENGMKSILVLSGETTKDMLPAIEDEPSLVLPALRELF